MKDALDLGNRWIDLVLLLWEHFLKFFYGDTPLIIYFFNIAILAASKVNLSI